MDTDRFENKTVAYKNFININVLCTLYMYYNNIVIILKTYRYLHTYILLDTYRVGRPRFVLQLIKF